MPNVFVRKQARAVIALLMIVGGISAWALPSFAAPIETMKASLAAIPTQIDSPEKGPFVDLVKAIAAHANVKLQIDVFPFARSIENVVEGRADFHVPAIGDKSLDESALPYRFVTENMGKVCFVIYSNAEKPITAEMIANAVASGQPFPYNIDVPGGIEGVVGFPAQPSNDLATSLQMVSKKRIDALVWAQEEVDAALRSLKVTTIHREHWRDLDDDIVIAKGPHGDEVNAVLSKAMREMRQTGELERLHARIHHAYDAWQPVDLGK